MNKVPSRQKNARLRLCALVRPACEALEYRRFLSYATVTGGTLTLDASASGGAIAVADSGITVTVTAPAGQFVFPDASMNAVMFAGTSGDDALSLSTTLTKPLSLHGGAGNDTFSVNAGTFTAASDFGESNSNLILNVGNGSSTASLILNSSQHLAGLNVAAGATASLSADGQHVLVTNSLSVTGTGKLDLADNSIIVRGGDLGAWNGTKYSGLTALIASGRNSGAWDGNGIITSVSIAKAPTSLTTIGIAQASDALGLQGTQSALWRGEVVDSSCVLITYTYFGDANLSRAINADDYFQLDSHDRTIANSARSFFNGDFTFDGRLNGDDYFGTDSAYAAQAASGPNYSSGFESPQYSKTFINSHDPTVTGNVRGQDAATSVWRESTADPIGSEGTLTGTAVVETDPGGSGADLQDLQVTRTQYDDRWSPAVTYTQNSLKPIVHIDWSMKVMQTTTEANKLGPFFGMEAYDRPSGATLRIGGLGVDSTTGEILYEDATLGLTGTPANTRVAFGVYNNFEMTLDYRSHIYSISLNGQQLGSGISFVTAGVAGLSDADISALQAAPVGNSNQSGTAFFDNYAVTAAIA